MPRFCCQTLLSLGLIGVLMVGVRAQAPQSKPEPTAKEGAKTPPKDNWKTAIYAQGRKSTLWLLQLSKKDDKWTGSVVAINPNAVNQSKLSAISVKDGLLRFTLTMDQKDSTLKFEFEGKEPAADAKKILGTMLVDGRNLLPAELERTPLTSLDLYDLAQDSLAHTVDAMEIIDASETLLQMARDKKAKIEEVRGWAAKFVKASEAFGPRWHRESLQRLTELLLNQKDFGEVALEYARKAERLLEPGDKPILQKRTLDLLVKALEQAKKADEAKTVKARMDKIDTSLKITPFAGRKAKSDRVVLVELFTATQPATCIAASLAFDGLLKTYKPNDVVALQYHLHVPNGADPLSNPDCEARAEFYGDALRELPTAVVCGRSGLPISGNADAAEEKYQDLRRALEPTLEREAKASLSLKAKQTKSKIDIQAEVGNVQQVPDRLKLFVALVEDKVDYKSPNGVTNFQGIVRTFVGGSKGLEVKEKDTKHSLSLDLDEVKKNLKKYLDDFGEKDSPFPTKERPLELKNLRIVAFIQNTLTKEVIQAAQVEVRTE